MKQRGLLDKLKTVIGVEETGETGEDGARAEESAESAGRKDHESAGRGDQKQGPAHSIDPKLIGEPDPDGFTGLTAEEVEEKRAGGLVNEEVDSSTRTVQEIVKENLLTYFNLIFTVLAVLLIIVGQIKDLTFMLIVIANALIGICQEIRSKKILDELRFEKMPRVMAVRDGLTVEVDTDKLVLDDLVILGAGCQIPADAKVVKGSVQVNEALVTGESDEIVKDAGDGLLSGSFIVSGECHAKLTAVGRDSYISKLKVEATKQGKNDDRSEMVQSLDKLVKVIGIIIIPIGTIMLVQQLHFMHNGFAESVSGMVAAVVGMIPEGLYMMASIALVVSAMRLARQEVLVQNMRSIETLARVDVLCVDKTGTITENTMKVDSMQSMVDEKFDGDMEVLIGDLASEMSPDNATMEALQEYFTETSGRKALRTVPFSSRYKYCAAIYDDGNYVLGAPEFVLGESYRKYESRLALMGEKGYRVLAFAVTEHEPAGDEITGNVKMLAAIFLTNPIRHSAPETFKYFAENGVDIKVISGDNPATVSNIAQEAGIKGADRFIDARELKDQGAIDDAVLEYNVFGRVTPEQKRMFVSALKYHGKKVGMTGDGVNDILALRDADCSIAMASGSEAASNAAQLVLMDSDFSRMPDVVAEGRRVVNNITKTATLYLTKNIFSFLLALFSMISVLQYPLQPSQITLISAFTIGIPSFVLALEPNHRKIKGNFLANVFKMAAPAGITVFLSVSALLVFGDVMKIEQASLSTAAAALVALVEFMILARVARPMTRTHLIMIVLLVVGFFYAIIFHNEFFGISDMTWQTVLLLIVFLIATQAVFRYFYKFTTYVGKLMTPEGRGELRRANGGKLFRIRVSKEEKDDRAEKDRRSGGGSRQ